MLRRFWIKQRSLVGGDAHPQRASLSFQVMLWVIWSLATPKDGS